MYWYNINNYQRKHGYCSIYIIKCLSLFSLDYFLVYIFWPLIFRPLWCSPEEYLHTDLSIISRCWSRYILRYVIILSSRSTISFSVRIRSPLSYMYYLLYIYSIAFIFYSIACSLHDSLIYNIRINRFHHGFYISGVNFLSVRLNEVYCYFRISVHCYYA